MSLNFILGKARVALIKRMTTPNPELLAATSVAKLALFIKEEAKLFFRFNRKLYRQRYGSFFREPKQSFLCQTFSTILSTSTVSQLCYVSTALNQADDGTRGIPVLESTPE